MKNEKLEVLIAKLVGMVISVAIMIPSLGKDNALPFFITAIVYSICKVTDVSETISYSGYKTYFYVCITELTSLIIGIALCFAALAYISEQRPFPPIVNYVIFMCMCVGSLDDVARICSFLYRMHYTKKQLNEFQKIYHGE